MKKLSILICVLFFTKFTYANNEDLEKFGDNMQFVMPLISVATVAINWDYDGLQELTEGALYTAALTHGLKYTISEKRPNGNDNDSFPSGHTSNAFQNAAFLDMRYGHKVGIPAYTIASIVGYSRVESKHHYWHDVGAGAAIAIGVQYLVSKKGYSLTNLQIFPIFTDEETMIVANYRF